MLTGAPNKARGKTELASVRVKAKGRDPVEPMSFTQNKETHGHPRSRCCEAGHGPGPHTGRAGDPSKDEMMGIPMIVQSTLVCI